MSEKYSVCCEDLDYAILNNKKIHRLLTCHDCGFVIKDKNSCGNIIFHFHQEDKKYLK